MGENTKIEWCRHTFNPWVGCQKISPACDHCYAESWAKRSGHPELWQGDRRRTRPANWAEPLKWNAQAQLDGTRPRVFCSSLADVFDNAVDPQWRADLMQLILKTRHLDWLLLTKRVGNAAYMIAEAGDLIDYGEGWQSLWGQGEWPSNVWLGATIANQAEADRDIPKLLATPARLRFLSCEPLLGPIDLGINLSGIRLADGTRWTGSLPLIDWVIAGGESGAHARPSHPDWFRSLRDQCAAAGVPFHFKQHGEWIGVPDLRNLAGGIGPGFGAFDHCQYRPDVDAVRVGKKAAGRTLDGVIHDGFPTAERA